MKKPPRRKQPPFTFSAVLLVDDSELDNFINQKILEANYFAETIYTCSSGNSAIELLKNFLTVKKHSTALMPQVIFVDMNMPFMNGVQFIEQVLQLSEKTVDGLRLVALTSSIDPEDKKRVMEVSEKIIFLNKPLTDEALALVV